MSQLDPIALMNYAKRVETLRRKFARVPAEETMKFYFSLLDGSTGTNRQRRAVASFIQARYLSVGMIELAANYSVAIDAHMKLLHFFLIGRQALEILGAESKGNEERAFKALSSYDELMSISGVEVIKGDDGVPKIIYLRNICEVEIST